MAGSDVRQLILQVDASVALAQRNLQQLAQTVDGQASRMDSSLSRVDKSFSRMNNSAEASAKAFQDGRAAADQLIGSIDPLYAAQIRYDRELEKAQQLQRQGALTAAEFAKVQGGLKASLDEQVGLYGGVAKGVGNARIAQMELMHVVRGSVDQYAAGAAASQIFAMHIGMIGQAAVLGGESLGKFGKFLGGGWGIALTAAVSIMATLISKHKEAGESVDNLVEKMRKQHTEALLQESANKVWAESIDGVREAQKKLRGELEKSLEVEGVVRQKNLEDAQNRLDQQRRQLADREQALKPLQAERPRVAASLQNPDLDPGAAAAIQGRLAQLDGQIHKLSSERDTLKAGIKESESTLREARVAVSIASADASTSASTAIQQSTQVLKAAVEASGDVGRITADQVETARAALNKYADAQERAASAGVNFGKVGAAKQIGDLTKGFASGKVNATAFTKSVEQATDALNKAAKAAEDAKKKTSQGLGYSGKEIGFSEAAQIARGAGFQVNSAQRSFGDQKRLYDQWVASGRPKDNPVAPPGTSAHEGAKGRWALDIQLQPGLTAAKVKKVYADEGVSVNVFPERGHLHVSGSRSQAAAADRAQETAEKAAQRLDDRQKGSDDDYRQKLDALNKQLLAAQMELVQGTQEQAAYAADMVRADQQYIDDQIDRDAAAKKRDGLDAATVDVQATALHEKNAEVAEQRLKNVEIHKQIKLLQEEGETSQQAAELRKHHLEFLDSIARTLDEHSKLQRHILDISYQERLAQLESLKQQKLLAGEYADAAKIQQEINDLPRQKAEDQYRLDKSNQGPLAQYRDSLPQSSKEMSDRLQGIEVDGLHDVVDVLAEARHGWKAMGDAAISALDDIAGQLIKLQLDRWMGQILGAGKKTAAQTSGAAELAQAGAGLATAGGTLTAAGAPLTAAGNILVTSAQAWAVTASQITLAAQQLLAANAAGGGGGAGGAAGLLGALLGGGGAGGIGSLYASTGSADLDAIAFAGLPGFASGGAFGIGGRGGIDNNVLSINGVARARVSSGETLAVIPRMPRASIPSSANSNVRGGDTFHINVTAPNTGNPRRDRATSLQQAADVRRAIGQAAQKDAA